MDSSHIQTLIEQLQLRNFKESEFATQELIRIGTDEVVNALDPLLAENYAARVAYILQKIGTEKALDTLRAYSHLSISAVLSLALIAHPKDIKTVSHAALREDWYEFLLSHHLVVHFLIRHNEIAPIIRAFYRDRVDKHFIMRLASTIAGYDDERFIDGLEKWSRHKLVGTKMIYALRHMSSPRAKEIVQNWYSRKGMRYS